MEVTEAQEIALKAMFEYWNFLSNVGSSRKVAFYVDGDGSFHPQVTVDGEKPRMSAEFAKLAIMNDNDGNRTYDSDNIAAKLRETNTDHAA